MSNLLCCIKDKKKKTGLAMSVEIRHIYELVGYTRLQDGVLCRICPTH
jgi:hypothetical protein